MRNITTEEFREFDGVARELINDHIEPTDLDSLDNMMSLLDSMQDSMESATIEPSPTFASEPHVDNPHRDFWVLRSMENFEIVEARVYQLLLLSLQSGGWEKVDQQEKLWR